MPDVKVRGMNPLIVRLYGVSGAKPQLP
jgi:hypothetical protein